MGRICTCARAHPFRTMVPSRSLVHRRSLRLLLVCSIYFKSKHLPFNDSLNQCCVKSFGTKVDRQRRQHSPHEYRLQQVQGHHLSSSIRPWPLLVVWESHRMIANWHVWCSRLELTYTRRLLFNNITVERTPTQIRYTQKQYLELLVEWFRPRCLISLISFELSQHKCANGLTVCGYF